MFIAFSSELGYMTAHGRDNSPPRQTFPQGPIETPETKLELHMTFFLPKTAEARQELLSLLIAIPVSLAGTAFMLFLLDGAGRLV